MNGLGKLFRKKSDKKNRKTVKIKVKLPHVNKKPLARKRIFVQTPFSHSTLKLEQKTLRRKTPLTKKPRAPQYSSTQLTAMKKIRKSQNQQLEKKGFERAFWHPNIAGRLPEK